MSEAAKTLCHRITCQYERLVRKNELTLALHRCNLLTPINTNPIPTAVAQPKGSFSNTTAINVVITGPTVPVTLVRAGPMCLIAALAINVGSTVANNASAAAPSHRVVVIGGRLVLVAMP